MAALYSVSVKTPGAIGANAPCATIRSALTGQGSLPWFKRITIVNHANPASTTVVDVYRVTNANYGTATVSLLGQAYKGTGPVSGVNVDTAWSSVPTLPGTPVPFDGISISGAVGSGQVITFPDDFTLEPNTAILLWCPSASSQLRITPVWGE